ncbi:MAG: hypothetical protein JST83_07600 [Bacteroidetes bacterium]|nr:hypothetical protein [Bacteroidota bacterium]
MKEQNYSNHIFYYWPHHFFFYGSIIAAFVLCGLGIWYYPQQRSIWILMTIAIFLIVYLGFMTRQHYALGLQNRLVRQEMHLRYYILTQQRFEEIERQLPFKVIAALRFASDQELVPLIHRAISESLSPDQVKRNIRTWLPDHMRV